MASRVVHDGELQAVTEWCNDTQWREREPALSVGVWRRLATVDRALYASNRIAEMLIRDQRGKSDARENDDVSYHGLNVCDVEALSLAMVELGDHAERVLGEVRENASGCCGTAEVKS